MSAVDERAGGTDWLQGDPEKLLPPSRQGHVNDHILFKSISYLLWVHKFGRSLAVHEAQDTVSPHQCKSNSKETVEYVGHLTAPEIGPNIEDAKPRM